MNDIGSVTNWEKRAMRHVGVKPYVRDLCGHTFRTNETARFSFKHNHQISTFKNYLLSFFADVSSAPSPTKIHVRNWFDLCRPIG